MVSDFRLRQIAQNIYDKKPGYSFEKVLRLYPKYFIKIYMYYRSIELQHMKELEKAEPTINKLLIKNTFTNLSNAANIAIEATHNDYNIDLKYDAQNWQTQREQLIIACQKEQNISYAFRDEILKFVDNYCKLSNYLGQPITKKFSDQITDLAKSEGQTLKYYQELEQAARQAANADQFYTWIHSVMRKYSGD